MYKIIEKNIYTKCIMTLIFDLTMFVIRSIMAPWRHSVCFPHPSRASCQISSTAVKHKHTHARNLHSLIEKISQYFFMTIMTMT